MSTSLEDKPVNVRVHYPDPVAAHAIGRSTERCVWAMLGADLSEGEVQLSSPEMLAVNTRLLLSIEPQQWGRADPRERERSVGRANRIAEPPHIGVSFTDLSNQAHERLRALVTARQRS